MIKTRNDLLTSVASAALLTALATGPAIANDVYAGFPVTVKGYDGDKKTSVAYTGQIARHVLHDSLKKLAGKGNGMPNNMTGKELVEFWIA